MTTTKPVAGYIGSRRYAFLVGTDRVVIDHRIMGGVPCIAGTRIPVATIVGLIAEGLTADGVIADYPQLTDEDVRAALEYLKIEIAKASHKPGH